MYQPHCTHAKRVGFDAPCVFAGLMQQVCTFRHSKWDGRKMKLPNAAIVLVYSWFTSYYSTHCFSKLQGENVFQLHWTPWDNLCVRASGPLWHVLRGNLAAQRLSKKPHPDLFMFTLHWMCIKCTERARSEKLHGSTTNDWEFWKVGVLQSFAPPQVHISIVKWTLQKLNYVFSQLALCSSFAKTTNLLCPIMTRVAPHQYFNKRDQDGVVAVEANRGFNDRLSLVNTVIWRPSVENARRRQPCSAACARRWSAANQQETNWRGRKQRCPHQQPLAWRRFFFFKSWIRKCIFEYLLNHQNYEVIFFGVTKKKRWPPQNSEINAKKRWG